MFPYNRPFMHEYDEYVMCVVGPGEETCCTKGGPREAGTIAGEI